MLMVTPSEEGLGTSFPNLSLLGRKIFLFGLVAWPDMPHVCFSPSVKSTSTSFPPPMPLKAPLSNFCSSTSICRLLMKGGKMAARGHFRHSKTTTITHRNTTATRRNEMTDETSDDVNRAPLKKSASIKLGPICLDTRGILSIKYWRTAILNYSIKLRQSNIDVKYWIT